MKKRILSALLCATMVTGILAGCAQKTPQTTSNSKKPTVNLTMWGQEQDQKMLQGMIKDFEKEYSKYANIKVKLGVQNDAKARDRILTDQEAAADVFSFPSDRLQDLASAGALQSIDDMSPVLKKYAGKTVDDVKKANIEGSVKASTYDGTFYAFPMTADNGYFLFYNKNIVSKEDVKSWDALLKAAQKSGKKVGMVFSSGWYNASFFYSAGFTTSQNKDGTTNINWNGKADFSGVDVTKAMLKIASNPGFMPLADGDVSNQIASGKLCAAVSGTWDADVAQKAFKDGFAATKLPSFKIDNKDVQQKAVVGYKMLGVNSHSKNAGWAALLADFMTNEQQQRKRFEIRQIGPSNKKVLAEPQIKKNITASAVVEQSKFGERQDVGNNFWAPTKTFGEMVAKGQLKANDTAGIQKALDTMVAGVEAPIK